VEDSTKEEVYEFICKNWMSARSEDKLTKRIMDFSASRKLKPGRHLDICSFVILARDTKSGPLTKRD